VKLQKVSMDTLRTLCAGFAISATMAGGCAIDSDDSGPDAASDGELSPAGDSLDLWTGVKKPPYHAAALSLSHRVLELDPQSTGEISLAASLRWRDHTGGAVDPRVSFGMITSRGESTLAQVFESNGQLRSLADLAMSDVLEVGAWYRVVLTIADAPGRAVQVRLFDQGGAEVWRSCGGSAGSCPSARIDADDVQNLRLSVTVDDVREGRGQIELKDISLKQLP